ncbi:hypothetical protein XANCAGTX0491_007334 [Xanthoria calcicola]
MQYTSIFFAALAATTTLAAPWTTPSHDNKLQVTLSGPHTTPAQKHFPESPRTAKHPSSNGLFTFVELHVGKDVPNQATRCQILDQASKPIVIQRGNNTDITFGDGGKGKWTIRGEEATKVSQIICDPAFRQITAGTGTEIRVQLSNQATELAIQTAFTEGSRQEKAVNSSGPFTSVQIMVGALVQNQDYRCQVVDKAGQAVVATRNTNIDTTFSDAGKGEWTFKKESEVSKVIWDPAFKAAPMAPATSA